MFDLSSTSLPRGTEGSNPSSSSGESSANLIFGDEWRANRVAPGLGEDLKGKRVALGSRGSMQAGLLPYYFLHQMGLDPARDLAVCSYYDERQGNSYSDERDVVERIGRREYDAGAVSQRTIEALQAEGALAPDGWRS